MTEEKEFTKVHAEKPVARKIKAIAAMQGKHVYQVVEEMLEVYEAAAVETLPAPKGGKKVKVVKATRVQWNKQSVQALNEIKTGE